MTDKEEILQAIQSLRTDVDQRLNHVENQITELRSEVKGITDRLESEVKRWDERFFQLSKDTLSFIRSVITAGVIVAILVPAIKDLSPAIIQLITELMN